MSPDDVTIASGIQHERVTSGLLVWTVRNFSRLDVNTLYYQTDDETKCAFKLMKTSNTLFLVAYTNISRTRAKFYLLGADDEKYGCDGIEILECIYYGKLCLKMVLDPKMKFLVDDTLVLHFVYFMVSCQSNIEVVPYGQWRYKCCTDELRNNLAQIYKTSEFSDFEIESDGEIFKVHRPILIARSEYFSELFEKEFSTKHVLNMKAEKLQNVLRYIYTGELEEQCVDYMIDMLEIAQQLKVKSLFRKCEEYLKIHLDDYNFLKIMRLASKSKLNDLLREAIYYFVSNIEEFKEDEEYGEICKTVQECMCNFS